VRRCEGRGGGVGDKTGGVDPKVTYPSSTAASAVSVEYTDSDIFDLPVPTVSFLL